MLMEWVPNPEPLDDGDDGSGGDTLGESSAGRGVMSLARRSSRRRNTLPSPEVAAASGAEVGSSPGAGSVGGEAPLTRLLSPMMRAPKCGRPSTSLMRAERSSISATSQSTSAWRCAQRRERRGRLSRSEVDRLFRQVDIDRSQARLRGGLPAIAQHRLFEVNPAVTTSLSPLKRPRPPCPAARAAELGRLAAARIHATSPCAMVGCSSRPLAASRPPRSTRRPPRANASASSIRKLTSLRASSPSSFARCRSAPTRGYLFFPLSARACSRRDPHCDLAVISPSACPLRAAPLRSLHATHSLSSP